MKSQNEILFHKLFQAKDEDDVNEIVLEYPDLFAQKNWKPLGGNLSNYGIVKNQQSNPIAALIEKVTNSIDAILMKKCLQLGIQPNGPQAPRSMDESIEIFFPNHNWDLQTFRRQQAEEIQIIADGKGPKSSKNYPTSVIVYDNGEGQRPEDFEKTFLSLIRGNKNEIHFVQGKYNMGGSGAIVFCGRNRFHLIASKRFDGGNFGFTLIREHPKVESDQSKETWYEYLAIGGEIPSFPITELDLGLENRKFSTGTIVKMYSYQFSKGYSAFSQDLNQSINEFLYSPALPILTKDTSERYPNNRVLVTDLFGLRRRLLKEEDEYLDEKFSEDYTDDWFGTMKVSCFVFKTKVKSYSLKETKDIIANRYFRNGMSVLFSLNGQVHGNYSSEFITRSLKMNLLKNHLLIHVDCTDMKYQFRKELFMASRDRLKDGEETQYLRHFLADKLSSAESRLTAIEKRRKQAVEIDTSASTDNLLREFTKDMPFNSELMKLLGQTFKLEQVGNKQNVNGQKKKPSEPKEKEPFLPQKFPSAFKLTVKNDGETEVAKIPLGGERTIKFQTDVENDYFDRIEEPGELRIALLSFNENGGGGGRHTPNNITDVFNIAKSSPHDGTIKLTLSPKEAIAVGDSIKMKVTLTSPGKDFDEIFLVKVVDEDKPRKKVPSEEQKNEPLGLPPLIFAYKEKNAETPENCVSWEDVEEATSITMDIQTPMVPDASGDTLTRIFVNMECNVLLQFKSKYKNPTAEQIEVANRKYYTAVYFHTLFLYTITKNRGYEIQRKVADKNEMEPTDLGSYLKDIFTNYYSTFILNFGGAHQLMESLEAL